MDANKRRESTLSSSATSMANNAAPAKTNTQVERLAQSATLCTALEKSWRMGCINDRGHRFAVDAIVSLRQN